MHAIISNANGMLTAIEKKKLGFKISLQFKLHLHLIYTIYTNPLIFTI